MSKCWLVGSLPEHPLVPHLAQRFGEETRYFQLPVTRPGHSLCLEELTQQGFQAGDSMIYLNTPWRFVQADPLEEHLSLSLNLFHACLKQDTRLIYLSTHAVYGQALYTPLDEQHPLQGFSPYASSRTATDLLAQSYATSFDLDVTVVRLFPLFGPGYYSQLINSLHQHKEALQDLELQLDLLHLEDALDALQQIAQTRDLRGQVVNLGSGQIHTLDQVLSAIPADTAASNPALDFETTRQTARFLHQRSPDLSRLQQQVPWQAQRTQQFLQTSQP